MIERAEVVKEIENSSLKMKILAFVVMCGVIFGSAMAHTYKSGECPPLEPMQGFDMRKVRK